MNIKKKNWIGIQVTKTAQQYFSHLIKKNNVIGIQINIKKSGCAGFKYHLSFVKKNYSNKKNNFYIYHNHDIKIYISEQDMLLLDNVEIDYVTTDGINMHIKFNNPKIHEYCGCGDSFNVIQ